MFEKAMISQPMKDKSVREILEEREKAVRYLAETGHDVLNSLFTDEWDNESAETRGVSNIPIYFLAKSLDIMSLCQVAYFCKGWEKARGCKIEHEVAKSYGLKIIYEDMEEKENE